MLKKIVLLASLFVTSMTAQATLISHLGYERDSSSNIVTGGGLEWLKWDVTKGISINSALTTYSTHGWRLASNDEMASLFNRFKFGKNDDWNNNESDVQNFEIYWNATEFTGAHYYFLSLFGVTQEDKCSMYNLHNHCFSDADPLLHSFAFFGSDLNNNSLYNIAYVREDATYLHGVGRGLWPLIATLYPDSATRDFSLPSHGVALVRSIVPDPVAVPTPSSIGLLAFGLLALGYRRRQVLGC